MGRASAVKPKSISLRLILIYKIEVCFENKIIPSFLLKTYLSDAFGLCLCYLVVRVPALSGTRTCNAC